ncbi:MAG: ABC transporter ATP-binding protein [Candidatus Omnitrophica bacterium CG03_land_8_20_14_0_80_43_22]|nr:MAG: ABC transporter ATP-binding protein [Candidatus Omnitrophica bacterium CG03_land_8_20_14_0_80_43_22]
MANIAIKAEGIGKKYLINQVRRGPSNLRDHLSDSLRRALFYGISRKNPDSRIMHAVWALKDVSFEIERGSVVGIIGRNGAGKTTLLKILSRVIRPTSGSAEVYGRAGSLLEVGLGFHEELTGRENIYLNGAILGMKKREIDRKFDEIVSFSELEDFLETPIKYYSSGMYVRLAFAIAAHLQTEILLIDEILSVGDMRFQKKCISKIEEAGRERTVLFVSHNMSLVNALCSCALLLNGGRLEAIGDKESIIKKYIENTYKLIDTGLSSRTDRTGNGAMRFVKYHLENSKGQKVAAFRSGEDVSIVVEYAGALAKKLQNVSVSFVLNDFLGNIVTDLANRIAGDIWHEVPPKGIIKCRIKKLPLMPGKYTFNAFCQVNALVSDMIWSAGIFEVEPGPFFTSGRLPDSGFGPVLFENEWTVEGS